MRKKFASLAFLVAILFPCTAQDTRSLQDAFMEAEYFFVLDDYQDALPIYLQLYEKLPENANIAYRIGVCYLNTEGKKNLSVEYLERASANIAAKHREGTISQVSAPYSVLLDLAKSFLVNYKFDDAKEAFRKYESTLLPGDMEDRSFIEQQIKSCEIAGQMTGNPVSYSTENLGAPINDEKRNFNPVISRDGNTFAFMVSMKFYDAVMVTRLEQGKWAAPVNITPELQSDGDMFISCLSSDGNTLYLSRDDNFDSDLFTSSYDGKNWQKPVKLNKNINTKYWESHGIISADGTMLVFASDRPGGQGGLDLYSSVKTSGDWGPAINLGPVINTPFNEDRPFFTDNGKTLFFSSQGHTNMGGYDLFKSEMQKDNSWGEPVNLGYPLNTPDDNIYFMPSGNGRSGYISLFRDKEGSGSEDIYKITFR